MSIVFSLLYTLLLAKQAASDPQEAKCRALIQAMQARYNAAKTLSLTTTSAIYSEQGGKKQLIGSERTHVEARRPSFLRIEMLLTKPSQAVQPQISVSDGKSVWNYSAQDKRYTKTPFGSSFSKRVLSMMGPSEFFFSPGDSASLLNPNPSVTLRYLGSEKIAGANCDKIQAHIAPAFKGLPDTILNYYIDAGHLLRRVVSHQNFVEEKVSSLIELEVKSTILNKNLPDSLFVFTAPPGAMEQKPQDIFQQVPDKK